MVEAVKTTQRGMMKVMNKRAWLVGILCLVMLLSWSTFPIPYGNGIAVAEVGDGSEESSQGDYDDGYADGFQDGVATAIEGEPDGRFEPGRGDAYADGYVDGLMDGYDVGSEFDSESGGQGESGSNEDTGGYDEGDE